MRIFWRVFLAFWLATAILLAIVFSANEPWPTLHRQRFEAEPASSILTFDQALKAFEQSGSSAFLEAVRKVPGMRNGVILFGANGEVLSPTSTDGRAWKPIANSVLSTGIPEVARVGPRVGTVFAVSSPSGRHYAVAVTAARPLESRFHRLRFWEKLLVAMILAAVICFALSLEITRSLSNLRTTARRIANGDLSARPPLHQTHKSDELGELTRDVDAMAQRIEELMNAQRRFVANVSHELGAPLTRMQLAITLLHRELKEQGSPALEQVEREVDRLSELVQELLFLASLERRAIPSETLVPFSLVSLCQEIVRDNALEIEERGCFLTTAYQEVCLQAAPQALRRAIENVLRNAIRHAPPGSEIQFSCKPIGSPLLAQIEISDSGPGVPSELLSSIFEPFVRVTGRPGAPAGTGLGLAIAYEAVLLHGGTISAKNKDEGGLTVVIQIPAA